jgi:hypothetical protein
VTCFAKYHRLVAEHLEVRPGMVVYAMDHVEIGVVGRVEPERFELNANGSTTWITREALYVVERGLARLICNSDGLGDYEVAGEPA